MAQPYVKGPVHIYLGVGGGAGTNLAPGYRNPSSQPFAAPTPVYLGTCLEAPKIRTTPKWSPLMNDLAGDQESFDDTYQGVSTDIFGELTVYNWSVYTLAQTRPNPAGTEGVDGFGSVGTLMITEGFAYPIWLHFPYYQLKSAFSANGAPPGYHFFAGWMIGPDEEDGGTKPTSISVQFHCKRYYSGGSFFLRDRNMAGIPAVPPAGPLGV